MWDPGTRHPAEKWKKSQDIGSATSLASDLSRWGQGMMVAWQSNKQDPESLPDGCAVLRRVLQKMKCASYMAKSSNWGQRVGNYTQLLTPERNKKLHQNYRPWTGRACRHGPDENTDSQINANPDINNNCDITRLEECREERGGRGKRKSKRSKPSSFHSRE